MAVMKVNLVSAEDLREFMNLAWNCPDDIGVHDPEGRIADAKSILGLIALDYSKPVLVVSENEDFFKNLDKWEAEDEE